MWSSAFSASSASSFLMSASPSSAIFNNAALVRGSLMNWARRPALLDPPAHLRDHFPTHLSLNRHWPEPFQNCAAGLIKIEGT